MYDDVTGYLLNEVIKNVKRKEPFNWLSLIKKISTQEGSKILQDQELAKYNRVYGLIAMGSVFSSQLSILITKGYIINYEKIENTFILSKKGLAAKRFGNFTEYEISIDKKTQPNSDKYYRKFDASLISFLRKQPQKKGDISHIVNKFIEGKQDNVSKLLNQLIYLSRDKDILEIREFPEDDMQAQNDWWGNFIGVNIDSGQKVEDLLAKLSNGYLRLSIWERNPVTTKILEWTIPYLLGLTTGLVTCKGNVPKDTPKQKQSIEQNEKAPDQKEYDDATKNGNHKHNTGNLIVLKDSVTPTK